MEWGNVAQAASALVSFVALVIALWSARDKRNADSFAEVFGRLNRHETRIGSIEGDLRHTPNKDAVHDLHVTMAEMKGQIGALIERIAPMRASLDRVEQAMLEERGLK